MSSIPGADFIVDRKLFVECCGMVRVVRKDEVCHPCEDCLFITPDRYFEVIYQEFKYELDQARLTYSQRLQAFRD